jgi:arylsulfatase A-like enzyme
MLRRRTGSKRSRSGTVLLAALALLLSACGDARPRGAILIVVDTLRADHLGVYGYEQPTSPEIDAWAARGVVFERAFSTSPWTMPSFGSLLTGALPSRHAAGRRLRESGWKQTTRLDRSLATLPEALRADGVVTGAIMNNAWLPPAVGMNRGFDSYDFKPPTDSFERGASQSVDEALAWIDRQGDSRFFLMLHILDPHMTYDAPPPFRGMFTSKIEGPFELPIREPRMIDARADRVGAAERAFIVAAYDEEIASVDHALGRLFAALESRGLWNDLLVVLTSDHGEELFDHGGFEHGHTMHRELLHVPLLVWGPGLESGRRSEAVSLADVPVTIAEGMGLTTFEAPFGQSLWPAPTRDDPTGPRLLVAEGTLYGPEQASSIRWPLKVIVETQSRRRQLFQLEQDPGEERDLVLETPRVARALAEELQARLEAARSGAVVDEMELDAETREQLRVLGYVE